MSRHTPISGRLTRSFGTDPDTGEDLVVELREGEVEFRKEPTNRRLKRNEQLPCQVIKIDEIMGNLKVPVVVEESVGEVGKILERIAAKVPIAQFVEDGEKNLNYAIKVWLLAELKKEIENHA